MILLISIALPLPVSIRMLVTMGYHWKVELSARSQLGAWGLSCTYLLLVGFLFLPFTYELTTLYLLIQ